MFSEIVEQQFKRNLKKLTTKELYLLRQKLQGEDEEDYITHEIKSRPEAERIAAMQELVTEAQQELNRFKQ